jgi:hypothetical protein
MVKDGAMPISDKKTFINPTGGWSHFGTYIVELVRGTDTSIVPKNKKTVISENIVTVHDGSLGQSMGGISMKDSKNHNFHWGYPQIVCIRDEKNNLIWVNNDYRND